LAAHNNTRARAQYIAKYLTIMGKDTIPLGIGMKTDNNVDPLSAWAKDFDLSLYKGPVYENGVQELINIIESSTGPLTIIAIAPFTNLLRLIQLRSDLVPKVRVVAMCGSYKVCYEGAQGPCPEYNIKANLAAAQAVFSANWYTPLQIAPTDVGWDAVISGAAYQRLLAPDNDIITSTLIQNYFYWGAHGGYSDPKVGSSPLWDPVAAFMAFTENNNATQINYERANMVVNRNADTVVDANGQPVVVGASWKIGGLQNWVNVLVNKLTTN